MSREVRVYRIVVRPEDLTEEEQKVDASVLFEKHEVVKLAALRMVGMKPHRKYFSRITSMRGRPEGWQFTIVRP